MSPALPSDFLRSLDATLPGESDEEQGIDFNSSTTSGSFTSVAESFWYPSELCTEADTGESWCVQTKEDLDSTDIMMPHRQSLNSVHNLTDFDACEQECVCSLRVEDDEMFQEKETANMQNRPITCANLLAAQFQMELARSAVMHWRAAVVTRQTRERIAYLEYESANLKMKESPAPRCFNRVQKCLAAPRDPCLLSAELVRISYAALRVHQRCNVTLAEETGPVAEVRSPCQLMLLKEMLAKMRARFCDLQACDPCNLNHEERLAFWLNVVNAATLSCLCLADKLPGQPGQIFPVSSWVSFLQKSHIDVGGLEISAFEIEHLMLRACSKPPMGRLAWFFVQALQESRRERAVRRERRVGRFHSEMALEFAAPEVSFGISYPISAGCPPLRVYWPKVVKTQLLLNCAHYVCSCLHVDMSRQEVWLPVLFKYYSRDFGTSPAQVLEFVKTALAGFPDAVEQVQRLTGNQSSQADLALLAESRLATQRLEALQSQSDESNDGVQQAHFTDVRTQVVDFDWRLEVESQPIVCPDLEFLKSFPEANISTVMGEVRPSVCFDDKDYWPRSSTKVSQPGDAHQPHWREEDFAEIVSRAS